MTPLPPRKSLERVAGSEGFAERAWRLVERHPVPFLAALIVFGTALVLIQAARTSRSLVESKALLDAALYADAIAEVRSLYTSEVVERVRKHGIEVTHDYEHRDGAIPLPVTLSMKLGHALGRHGTGASTRLYSPYPFPWRADGGVHDDFEREAWKRLSADPSTAYHEFTRSNGRPLLRYARADSMRSACVDCHNSHPQSPKRDWKEGDVRGVLEVRFPMHFIEAQAVRGLRESLVLTALLGIAGIAVLSLVFTRLRRTGGALELSVDELRASHDHLSATHNALVRARDDALAASRAKTEFLSVMSHELKTPLNAILGYAEMLDEEVDASRPDLKADLGKIRTAARRLDAQISDILEFSRLDAGRIRAAVDVVSLSDLVRQAVGSVEGLGAGTVAFELVLPDEDVALRTDAARLRRALVELLTNALKFTKQGRIVLAVTLDDTDAGRSVVMRVEDTGIGMSDAEQARLFRPFSQLDASATRRFEGTGLGLALARATARLLGGDIEVRSEPGKGSVFTLHVPVEAPRDVSSSRPPPPSA